MGVLAAGIAVPEFTLRTADGEPFTREQLLGRRTLLVFYPFAFSPVCTDQLSLYEEVIEDFTEQGVTLYGVSCDATYSQTAFREQLGVTIEQLSDFEPKGAACHGVRRAAPGRLPAARARARRRRRGRRVELRGAVAGRPPGRQPDLRRAGAKPDRARLRPAAADRPRRSRARAGGRARGDRVRRLRVPVLRRARAAPAGLPLRIAFRHFPVRSSHPRAHAAACAAEAAALQGAFWPFHDALFADQGRLEDPHLWARAERLGLDVARFDADRRSDAVVERVRGDFRAGVKAGVATTPTLFVDGEMHAGRADDALLARLRA